MNYKVNTLSIWSGNSGHVSHKEEAKTLNSISTHTWCQRAFPILTHVLASELACPWSICHSGIEPIQTNNNLPGFARQEKVAKMFFSGANWQNKIKKVCLILEDVASSIKTLRLCPSYAHFYIV